MLLSGFAKPVETELLASLGRVLVGAPFRHMMTPGGYRMSVAMTNCGSVGWVTDRTGYRYDPLDPATGESFIVAGGRTATFAQRPTDKASAISL